MDNQAKRIMKPEDVKTVRDFLAPYQAKATPRPWKVSGTMPCRIVTKERLVAFTSPVELEDIEDDVTALNEANASLIVKAVNNHEALLEACKRAEQVLVAYQAPVLKALHSIMSQAIANAAQ